MLTNLLMHDDSRLVESACTCLTLMASNFSARPQHLRAMCAHGLIPNATRLIARDLPKSALPHTTVDSSHRNVLPRVCRGGRAAASGRSSFHSEIGPRRLQGVVHCQWRRQRHQWCPADQLLEVTTLAEPASALDSTGNCGYAQILRWPSSALMRRSPCAAPSSQRQHRG